MELLIKLVAGGPFSLGDIVEARDDGWAWGKGERPPGFGILVITGVTVAQAKAAILAKFGAQDILSPSPDGTKWRRFQFSYASVPAAVRTGLTTGTGRYTVAWSVARGYVLDLVSSQTV